MTAAEMSESVFQILEIEPTNDKKEIKKAYARLVKRYHPEEFPEEWEKIHGAYEQALKMAEHGKLPMTAEPPEPSMQMEVPKLPMQEEYPGAEPPEMDALFDNIGEMAREKHRQDKEAFKCKVQEILNDFSKISGKQELDIKEWEAFFDQKKMLPYICTREFLERLGDCFENRTIEYEMYCFLKKQLAVITEYSRDEQIELQNIGLVNPVDYAEKKIYKAYAGESAAASLSGSGTTRRKTRKEVWLILIIVISFLRSTARYANYTREVPKIQEIPMTTVIENTIADSTAENADNDIVHNIIANNIAENDGDVMRTHIPFIPDKIQIGDSREVMIEALGEPEEIRESQENPDYEEAVYWVLETRLVVVLENDVITDIYVEYTIEDAVSDTYPVSDSK